MSVVSHPGPAAWNDLSDEVRQAYFDAIGQCVGPKFLEIFKADMAALNPLWSGIGPIYWVTPFDMMAVNSLFNKVFIMQLEENGYVASDSFHRF